MGGKTIRKIKEISTTNARIMVTSERRRETFIGGIPRRFLRYGNVLFHKLDGGEISVLLDYHDDDLNHTYTSF